MDRIFTILCVCFSLSFILFGAAQATTGFYFDFTDCGVINFSWQTDDKICGVRYAISGAVQFRTNHTVARRMAETAEEEAKLLAQEIDVDHFVGNIVAEFFVDRSDPFFPIMAVYNNTHISNRNEDHYMIAEEFFQSLHSSMLRHESLPNSKKYLIPVDISEVDNVLLHKMWLKIKSIPAPRLGQIYVHIKLRDTILACVQFNWRTESMSDVEIDENVIQKKNFASAMSTPKIAQLGRADKLKCPRKSSSTRDGGCNCAPPYSGPYCMFMCNFDQIELVNKLCSAAYRGPDGCSYTSQDYSKMCLIEHNVSLLDNGRKVGAIADSFSLVTVSWRMNNYFTMGPYVVKFTVKNEDNGLTLGLYWKRVWSYNGMKNVVNVTSIVSSEDDVPSKLVLQSFTNYSLTLSVRSTAMLRNKNDYIDVETTYFSSPEGVSQSPRILKAEIVSEKHIDIDWVLTDDHCPGVIRRNEIRVWCNSEADISIHNDTLVKAFNCRKNFTSPHFFLPLQKSCFGEKMNVQLRVATSEGYGNWSDPYTFSVPSKPWTTWMIIIVSVAGFILATVVFTVAFTYYYKKHIKKYMSGHKMWHLRELLRGRPLPSRPDTNGNANREETEFATPNYHVYATTGTRSAESGSRIDYEVAIFPTEVAASEPESPEYITPIFLTNDMKF